MFAHRDSQREATIGRLGSDLKWRQGTYGKGSAAAGTPLKLRNAS